MGRASNAKKVRRQAQARATAEADRRRASGQFLAGLQPLRQELRARDERLEAARRVWCAGSDPVAARLPAWPEDSLGGRFYSGPVMTKAAQAPSLSMAAVPDAPVIAAAPAHCTLALFAAVRAVVLDDLLLEDPGVSALLDALGPLAEAELADGQAGAAEASQDGIGRMGMVPGFCDDEGPVFFLGCCALVDAADSVIGEDPLAQVLDVLRRRLDGVVPGVAGRVIAEALVRAFAHHHSCELPGDAELLERLGESSFGDPLQDLVAAGELPARDALRAGLAVLRALGGLCKSTSVSVLAPAA